MFAMSRGSPVFKKAILRKSEQVCQGLQVRHVRSFQNAGVFQTGNEMLRDCWRDGEGFRKKTRAKGESLENPPMSPLFYIKNRLLSTYEQRFFELFLQVFGTY